MPVTQKKAVKSDSLREKMAKSVAGSAPSVIPAGIGGVPLPPPWPEKEKAADITELIGDADERETLAMLIDLHTEVNARKKALEDQLEPIKNRIKTMLGSYGITSMTSHGASVNYFRTERKTINGTKLLMAGVAIGIVEECTDVSFSATLKITPPQS